MRRFLGLTFLLGAIACAGSAGRSQDAPEATATVTSSSSPRGGTAIRRAARGSARAIREEDGDVAQAPTDSTCTSNLTLHGTPGTVISQPSVTLLFWGSYWAADGVTEKQQYTTAWSTLAGDPAFYARFAEYSTSIAAIGVGSWAGATHGDPSLASGALITEAQIRQELAAEITAGTALSLTANRVYVVMLPPNVTSQLDQQNEFAGHHAQFIPTGATLPVRYAVITYDADPGYTNPVVSHELAEAMTDPDLFTGWYDPNGNEISDVCRFDYGMLDGYSIERTWSMRSCSCVGGTASTGTTPDAGLTNAPACTAPAWSASATYTGGTTVSYASQQYTAAYWNQNDEPDTHNGATGTGQPWLPPVACAPTTCTPACGGKQCGGDGCGGTCGTCGSSQTCNGSAQCVAWCVPSCNLKQCGSDGCGGSCGSCSSGLTCNPNNQCVAPCVPVCNGKQCGGDTCGGSCGACASGQACTTDGICRSSPASACTGLTPWSPAQPWYAYSVGEQHTGSNGHRYTCKNVAYCIDDPTAAVGGTYGWTDDGPC